MKLKVIGERMAPLPPKGKLNRVECPPQAGPCHSCSRHSCSRYRGSCYSSSRYGGPFYSSPSYRGSFHPSSRCGTSPSPSLDH